MILQTGVGIAVASYALVRTFTHPTRSQAVALLDLLAVIALAIFIMKGLCA